MKKQLILIVLMIIGLLVCGTAFGGDIGSRTQKGFGPPPTTDSATDAAQGVRPEPPHRGHLGLLTKYQMDNLMIQVLSTITGQPTDTIAAAMQEKSAKDLLDSYGIDRTTFETAMDAQMIALINKSVECGSITQVQADEIIANIKNRPAPPESASSTGNTTTATE